MRGVNGGVQWVAADVQRGYCGDGGGDVVVIGGGSWIRIKGEMAGQAAEWEIR